MNGAHLHLALNHLPIFALAFGLACIIWGHSRSRRTILSMGLVFTVLAGAGAGGAFLTGEPAEEIVEEQPGIDEDLIHEHEDAAAFGLWLTVAAALLAAATLWRSRREAVIPGIAVGANLAAGVLAMGALAVTAWRGGEISHPEIRAAESAPAAQVAPDSD
jgi:drug/metabolite transporter (DMT)-like permease